MARQFSFTHKHAHEVSSAHELMQLSGLDWKVTLEDLEVVGQDYRLELDNLYATVRNNNDGSHNALSVVGSRYKVFQNSEIFSSLDTIVNKKEARYGAAGELESGKVVWAVLELPNDIKIGNDEHYGYVLARNSHDGSTPFQMTPMINRIACTNQINATMFAAKKSGMYYSVRHSTGNVIDPEDIKAIFGIMKENIQEYTNVSNWLLGQQFSDADFNNFIKKVYPLPFVVEFADPELLTVGQKRARSRALSRRTSALSIWNGETETQQGIAGTKFAAFQTIVETADHKNNNLLKQEKNIIIGKDVNIKSRALELLR